LKNNQETKSLDDNYLINSNYYIDKIQKIIEFFRAEKSSLKLNFQKEFDFDIEDDKEKEKTEGIVRKIRKNYVQEEVKGKAEDIQLKKIFAEYFKEIKENHDIGKIGKYKEIKI